MLYFSHDSTDLSQTLLAHPVYGVSVSH